MFKIRNEVDKSCSKLELRVWNSFVWLSVRTAFCGLGIAKGVVTVHWEGAHRPIARETQGGICEKMTEEILYQRLGSTSRNLIVSLGHSMGISH